MMKGRTTVTYAVHTMRDGVRTTKCTLDITDADILYLTREAGWFNPRCEEVRS